MGVFYCYNKDMILGIDEVGRGPWAGPLVVGAVVLSSATIDGLTDSKKLSKKRRLELDILIREKAAGIGLGWVSAVEIDKIGLSAALKLATKLAVEQVLIPYHEIIIDGTVNFLAGTTKGQYVTTMKKADLLVPSVSAASIIAKVARDKYMIEQDSIYPEYGFKNHVGYGTAAHISAISTYGVTPLHRLSFAPLMKYAKNNTITSKDDYRGLSLGQSTKEVGDKGEDTAVRYLEQKGHTILDRNWKTRFCEIDIISQKGDVMYFNEVKYRKNSQQGGGLSAITPKKLKQMRFAVSLYVAKNAISDTSLRLAAISVVGDDPKVEAFLEVI